MCSAIGRGKVSVAYKRQAVSARWLPLYSQATRHATLPRSLAATTIGAGTSKQQMFDRLLDSTRSMPAYQIPIGAPVALEIVYYPEERAGGSKDVGDVPVGDTRGQR